ncbi:MAG: nickel pincer cofactor biosynthesis protein LarB [Dehalococcoidia bacterium]
MDTPWLREVLAGVRDGRVPIEDALGALRSLPYEDLGFAKVDHHRELREGFPEVVLGLGKTPEQVAAIAERIGARSGRLLVTRATAGQMAAVTAVAPDAVFHGAARAITIERRPMPRMPGVMVLCAGTADLPVAEEAALTAEMMGNAVDRHYDVGVAGIHRLLDRIDLLRRARALVVVAGMEGALPSVVAGLVSTPVIAVPTSVGYGAHFGGLAPLLAMLNSCAAGVAVVNIDNGFGAGYMAALINRRTAAQSPEPDAGLGHAPPTRMDAGAPAPASSAGGGTAEGAPRT